jgi:hypothetical protein
MFTTEQRKWDQDINTVGGLKDAVFYDSCYSNAASANTQQGKISCGINHITFSAPNADLTVDVPYESGYLGNRVFVDYNSKIQNMIDMGKTNSTLDSVNEKHELEGKTDAEALNDKMISAIVNPAKSIDSFSSIPGLIDSHFIHESYGISKVKTINAPSVFEYVKTGISNNAKSKRSVRKWYGSKGVCISLGNDYYFIDGSGTVYKYKSMPKNFVSEPNPSNVKLTSIMSQNALKINEITSQYLSNGLLPEKKEKFEGGCGCKKKRARVNNNNNGALVLVIIIIIVVSTCIAYNQTLQNLKRSFIDYLNGSSFSKYKGGYSYPSSSYSSSYPSSSYSSSYSSPSYSSSSYSSSYPSSSYSSSYSTPNYSSSSYSNNESVLYGGNNDTLF